MQTFHSVHISCMQNGLIFCVEYNFCLKPGPLPELVLPTLSEPKRRANGLHGRHSHQPQPSLPSFARINQCHMSYLFN